MAATVTSEEVAATCEGNKAVAYTAKVTEGGKEFTDKKTVETENTALGHSWTLTKWNWAEDNTATADFTCETCKTTKNVTATVTSEEKAATCTANKAVTYTATAKAEEGGKEFTDSKTVETPDTATGHSWGDWETTIQPTTEADGEKERVCDNCGTKETGTIPKLPGEGDGQSDSQNPNGEGQSDSQNPDSENKGSTPYITNTGNQTKATVILAEKNPASTVIAVTEYAQKSRIASQSKVKKNAFTDNTAKYIITHIDKTDADTENPTIVKMVAKRTSLKNFKKGHAEARKLTVKTKKSIYNKLTKKQQKNLKEQIKKLGGVLKLV